MKINPLITFFEKYLRETNDVFFCVTVNLYKIFYPRCNELTWDL